MKLDHCFSEAEEHVLVKFPIFDAGSTIIDLCVLSPKLRIHRDSLPTDGRNRKERVASVLAFLRDQSNPGELLDEMLNKLLKRTEDPMLKATIIRLSDRLRVLLQTKLLVIVAAMKDHEARDLFNGTLAAHHQQLYEKVSRLGQSVTNKGFGIDLEALQGHYQEQREDWQPYGDGPSILHIVTSIHQKIPEFQEQSQPPNEIHSRTKDFLGDEVFRSDEQRAEFLATIRDQRCLLVIDALSLFHPDISRALHTPGFAEMNHLAILVLAPGGAYSAYQEELYKLILDEIAVETHNYHLRFQDDSDPLCEFGIADDMTLRRRLRTIMPKIGMVEPKAANTTTKNEVLDHLEAHAARGFATHKPKFNL